MGRPASCNAGSDSFSKKYCLSAIAATVAETVTFPLDITKTRLQIQGEHASKNHGRQIHQYRGMVKTAAGIVTEEGLSKLWQGLPPAVLRHFVYSGCRMGFYEYLRDYVMKKDTDGYFPLWKSIVAGMSAGAAAQFLASPTDLVKVQMQMEGKRLLEGRTKRYRGTMHAFQIIVKENGIRGLWRGWLPNVQRAALVNLGDLTTYDTAKHTILRKTGLQDNYVTHTLSSICSGLVAATLGTPADVIKTRIMNNPDQYKGSLDCFVKAVKYEGFFSLYKGFLPTWARMAPWSLTFWLTFEQIRRFAGSSSF
ncbi:mitochondrial uncoupling protein 4-like [Hydractinia symbiolongicarpus]|uniref:mitochondrial uncoupling protein 4-like n=1 Tax=Hydractinia symbiolongicarpus TaxID=13093 RepID=UPI0025509E16|nr:mitochondrial uncoupling protein 4-like [Hydractinia symbiolongicarpus]